MPRAFTDQEKKAIIERLLEAGQRQFSTYGLKKTSVEELAAAAGISKGAFYLFYESKEALFMDVVERIEERLRVEVLAVIEQAGPSARARLLAVFQKAFSLLKAFPLLQNFSRPDYDLLSHHMPLEKLQEHRLNDLTFIEELIDRCRAAGIPIRAEADQIRGLMYLTVLATIQADALGPNSFPDPVLDLLLELIAAYCLGEITIQGPMAALAGAPSEHHYEHKSSH